MHISKEIPVFWPDKNVMPKILQIKGKGYLLLFHGYFCAYISSNSTVN